MASSGLASILVTPFQPALLDASSCLSTAFYGNYKGQAGFQSVFVPDQTCLESWLETEAELTPSAHITYDVDAQHMVWLEEADIDDSLRDGMDGLNEVIQRLDMRVGFSQQQQVLSPNAETPTYQVLYRTQDSALLSCAYEQCLQVDGMLPQFYKSTLLPPVPVAYTPLSSQAEVFIEQTHAALHHDSAVKYIVDSISAPQMRNDIRFLTGEDPKSNILSRHSFAEGSRTAAEWLKERFEGTGADCDLRYFLEGFAPNVICRFPSTVNTTGTVLISGHYDSRPSFGSTRAPGGNDDGSGTVALLGVARAIARAGVKFKSNVEIVAYAGEEQGLLGSRAYARDKREQGANLTMVIQADMIAYRGKGEPAQLGLPKFIGSKAVASFVAEIAALYSPELEVGLSAVCCSDHQSFHEQGFPATQLFERNGPILDPMYHNSKDLSDRDGYDFEQMRSIAKVQLASLLHVAGYDLSD